MWYVFVMLLGFYIIACIRFLGLAGFIGAVLWAFSSYFFIIIAAGHIWKFVTLVYIPPTIAGMVLAYRGKYLLSGGLLTAVFVALQIVSNHVQMSYYFFCHALYGGCVRSGCLAEDEMPRFLKSNWCVVDGRYFGSLYKSI